MADSILRLKVESTEYDSKLKKASQGLQHYIDNCRKVGGTLSVVEDNTLAFVRALGEMPTIAQGGTQSLREMTRSLTDLTIQYRSLTDEEKNSPFGQAMAQSIQTLTERAGQARDAVDDVNATIKNAASDTRVFDQIAGAAGLATASFQTLQGASKLLGVDLGDNVEVIAKLQAAMAVTNGLTQIQTALQKESALMQGIQALQTKALAAAQALNATNTTAATIAQGAFNAVAKANPYVLLATAIIAVGTAVVAYTSHTKEAAEETKQSEAAMNRAKAAADSYRKSMSSSFADMMTKYDGLKRAWLSLADTHQKQQWINDNKKAFEELGLSINNIKGAEDAFENNTGKIVDSFRRRAQAAALAARMVELYRQKMDLELQAKEVYDSKRVSAYDVVGNRVSSFTRDAGADTFNEGRYGMNAQGQYYFTAKGAKDYNEQLFKSNKQLMSLSYQYKEINRQIDDSNDKLTKLQSTVTTITTITGSDSDKKKILPVGSIAELTQKMQDLKNAQSLVTNNDDWVKYQEQIKHVEYQINVLKGEWERGLQATITINDSEILDQVRNVEDAIVDEKTMTVTVNTADAYNQVRSLTQDIEGSTVQFKFQPELSRGLSITSTAGLNAYISQIKQQIGQADLGSELYNSLTSKLADATMLQNLVKESLSVGLGTALFDIADETGQDFWDRVLSPDGVENADWQAIADAINRKRKEMGLDAITLDYNTGNVGTKSSSNNTNTELLDTGKKLVGGLSQVSSGLDNMGIKISDEANQFLSTAQGVISVIEGLKAVAEVITGSSTSALVSTGISLVQALFANTSALFANTAATTAAAAADTGEAVMDVLKVAAVAMAHGGMVPHAAKGYAVPGRHYSGDVTPIMANAGELVLNRAQQGNLASQLQEGDHQTSAPARPYVTGQDIFLGLNNYLTGSGQGEIITSKNIKSYQLIWH